MTGHDGTVQMSYHYVTKPICQELKFKVCYDYYVIIDKNHELDKKWHINDDYLISVLSNVLTPTWKTV